MHAVLLNCARSERKSEDGRRLESVYSERTKRIKMGGVIFFFFFVSDDDRAGFRRLLKEKHDSRDD